jgi:hypothetical protein
MPRWARRRSGFFGGRAEFQSAAMKRALMTSRAASVRHLFRDLILKLVGEVGLEPTKA